MFYGEHANYPTAVKVVKILIEIQNRIFTFECSVLIQSSCSPTRQFITTEKEKRELRLEKDTPIVDIVKKH